MWSARLVHVCLEMNLAIAYPSTVCIYKLPSIRQCDGKMYSMGSPDFEYDAMKQIRVRSHEC